VLAVVIAYSFLGLLAPLYQNVIRSFSENFIKKLNREQSSALVNKETKARGKLTALVLREWRGMNREPVYFLNGPFIIVLMPLVMGISIFFSLERRGGIDELNMLLQTVMNPTSRILVTCLVAAFLGSATSITCTALSRDAKHLSYMKSLPVKPSMYMGAKLIHGSIFGILGTIISLLIGKFLLKLDAPQAVLAFLIGIVLSGLLNILGLYMDTINPQLRWENPVAALKQNINAVIVILVEMAVVGLLGYIGFTKIKSVAELALYFGLIPAILSAVLLAVYFPFARKKIRSLEV
jgi:ABC-2 type transport system permease protein